MQAKSLFTHIHIKAITYKLYSKHGVYLLGFVKCIRSAAAVLIFRAAEVQFGGALCAGTCTLCRLQLVTKDDISGVELC